MEYRRSGIMANAGMDGSVTRAANPTVESHTAPHPAVFSDPILERIAPLIRDKLRILDPFAGVGKLATIIEPWQTFVGFEIEYEWARQSPYVICGNSFRLMPQYTEDCFSAIITSPAYGNRFADSYEARDGSHRRTYRHYLGRPLHSANSGQLQWGDKYRAFHVTAWVMAWNILMEHGVFVLNVKNHIRNGREQHVTEWHASVLQSLPGSVWTHWLTVPVHGYRYGDNRARIPYESILVFRKKPLSV